MFLAHYFRSYKERQTKRERVTYTYTEREREGGREGEKIKFSPWFVDGCLQSVPMSSYKDTGLSGPGPTHMTLCYFNHLFKGPGSIYSHTLRYLWLDFQHMNLKKEIIQPP